MAKADSPTKTCGEDGCGRPLRARGLCSTHYNQQHQPGRHAKVTAPCTWCARPCDKEPSRANRYGGSFCSLACRDAWRAATGNNPCPSAEARAKGRAALDSPLSKAKAKLRRAARGTQGRMWVAGRCGRCGLAFVGPSTGADLTRFCSTRCKRRTKASRRRARHRGAHHVPYSRAEIFKRDGYRCHLCKKLTLPSAAVPHPRAPVIDHLVPLGPGDDAAYNVATACFLCNSMRRDVGPAQLILFG